MRICLCLAILALAVALSAGAVAADAPVESVRVFVIPVDGPIMRAPLLEALEKALVQAKEFKADIVVWRLNTPGGRVDLADKIIRMIEGIDWARTVAWVHGPDKQALSAGAYLCLATHAIYMTPGSTIGAATPFTKNSSGSAAVDEKFRSAFRARFRSLAESRGHPVAVADAMVDHTVSVVQVFLDGKPKLVTLEEAKRLEGEHKKDGTFKVGKIVSKPGKIVTLTSSEAEEFGVSEGQASTLEELVAALGYEKHTAKDAEWLTAWVEKESQESKDRFEKLRTAYNTLIQQAQMTPDPRKRRAVLQACAKALVEIEKLAQDPTNDVNVPREYLNNMKVRLQALYNASHR